MIKPTTVLGQPAMWLRAPDGAEVTVLLHGGQIVSWIPAGDQERLYLSPQAVAGPGQAVRGGIPVCFPQFAKRGPLGQHGFSRQQRLIIIKMKAYVAINEDELFLTQMEF